MTHPDSNTRSALQEAAGYYLSLSDPSTTEHEREQAIAWLKGSPENVAEILKIVEINELYRKSAIWSTLQEAPGRAPPQQQPRSQSKPYAPISTAYLQHLKAAHLLCKWALSLTGFGFVAAAFLMGKVELVALSVTSLTLLGLFSMKERILEYRISRGFYGSNTAEARDLIQFIIEHGDRIDFNDGSGLRRPSLVSYPDDCAARRTRVPAGATAK